MAKWPPHKAFDQKKKNVAFQKYLEDGKTSVNYTNLQKSKAELTNATNFSKNKYFKRPAHKRNNPRTSSKTFWSIIKTFLVNDTLDSNFVEKANIFNDFFSRQCQPMSNDRALPLTFSFQTTNWLSNVNIRTKKISKIIQSWDQNKAHGHDEYVDRQ